MRNAASLQTIDIGFGHVVAILFEAAKHNTNMTRFDWHPLAAATFCDLPTALLDEPLNEGADGIGLRLQYLPSRQPLLPVWFWDAEGHDGVLVCILDPVWGERNV